MQLLRTILFIAGVGCVAITLPHIIVCAVRDRIMSRYVDALFATGCMMIAQYFV